MTLKSFNSPSALQSPRPPYAGLEEARDRLCSLVERAVTDDARLVRLEVEVPPVQLLDWLSAQKGAPRYYWCDREGRFEMAGLGDAHVIELRGAARISGAFEEIQARLPRHARHARYYGGFRFHFNQEKDVRWHDFKACRFVVPLVELSREADACVLACTLQGEESRREALRVLAGMSFNIGSDLLPLVAFQDRTDVPAQDGWCRMVDKALEDFRRTPLEKVVLARQTSFRASGPVNPWALLQRLAKKTQRVYLFCFQPDSTRSFLGASPERLYRRKETELESEALAGTRPRSQEPGLDRVYREELLADEKELREHRIVVTAIQEVLAPFCSTLQVAPEPDIVELAHCRHLVTPIQGRLLPRISDDVLLSALHPTPAVGGKPADAAIRWILDNEPFERGIYSSPVGWVGAEGAEFCVGIRSGLVSGETLALYAGAGIVAGSDPRKEWRELDAKMAQFLNIISREETDGSE